MFGIGGDSAFLNVAHPFGCSIDTFMVIPGYDPLIANFDLNPDTYPKCLSSDNKTLVITDLSTGATFGGWNFGDGSTSTSPNPTHTYSTANTYNVCVTVTNDCGSDTDCESVTVDMLTGIDEVELGSLLLYPNPSDGTFNLELSDYEGSANINVLDMTGRVVFTSIETAAKAQLSLNQLSSGTYGLIVRGENGKTAMSRLIKN